MRARPARRDAEVEAYLARLPFPARGLAEELRGLVRAAVPDARERLRYGCLFFVLEDAPFCYVSGARTHVTLGFPEGERIVDTTGRLVGTGRSAVRKATLAFGEPVPAQARGWVEQAAALARAAR